MGSGPQGVRDMIKGKFLFILTLFAFAVSFELSGANSGARASLSGFALPVYKKDDNSLQFILYGNNASNLGALLELKRLRLDIVDDSVKNVNEVVALDKAPIYPLTSSSREVKIYWRDKKHCRALLFTETGVYDKNAKILRGDAEVKFRSRELDIDGVGFDAFYDKRFIHIRSKVRLVIRPEARQKSLSPERKLNESKKVKEDINSNTGDRKK